MQQITEAMDLHKEWYERAKKQTLETLPTFIESIINYNHDYGTICHAVTAAGIGAMYAVNKSEQGGITGFQAGCIMWEFIRVWMHMEQPLALIDYQDMLYPQYEGRFQKTITIKTWEWLQKQASEKLTDSLSSKASDKVKAHWQSIVDGVVPFGYSIENKD